MTTPTDMKSKKDLTMQIQRIRAVHGRHRLYGRAQNLVIQYNHNMSMTEENDALWRKYMRCHYPGGTVRPEMGSTAAHYLKLMHELKYPKAVYAG